MRLVCLHADTVDALKRLNVQFDDLTPAGLWSSSYHLVGLTHDQFQALEVFHVQAEDLTPAQLVQAVGDRPTASAGQTATSEPRPTPAARQETAGPTADAGGRESGRGAGASEAEVPLAQARDGGGRSNESRAEPKAETKPDSKTGTGASAQTGAQNQGAQASGAQSGQKGGGRAAPQITPPAQANRKSQPAQSQAGGGQRYGTTRLRISVAGKYTEATVANGKIVVAGRSFDTPDQAAAELTKSRGDWTFWEYYDSTDGKWRMLTRDWDTVLKSAAPGGR